MYEAPKLERLGSFRELTLNPNKVFCTADVVAGIGSESCDGFRS